MVCESCVAEYGERMAQLIARARVETAFAQACAAQMTPAARRDFLQVLAGQGKRERPLGGPRKAPGREAQQSETDQGLLRASGDLPRN